MKKLLLLGLLIATSAQAQTIKSVTVDPANATAGQAVKVTVNAEGEESNCGLRVEWGNGEFARIKMEKDTKFPYVGSYTYSKPGNYTVRAQGERVGSRLPCSGKADTPLTVAATPAAAPAPTAAKAAKAAAAPACPEGYGLDKKSVNKKTGAYTCRAGKGAKAPEKKMECAGNLYYYEGKGVAGCRP